MALFRVIVECVLIVEADCANSAEHKATLNPGMYDHDETLLTADAVEVDEDGDEV